MQIGISAGWTETPAGLKACRTGLKAAFLGHTTLSVTVAIFWGWNLFEQQNIVSEFDE